MSKLSRTLKVALALFMAVFTSNVVPAAAYANNGNGNSNGNNGTIQYVWCQRTGSTWDTHIGNINSGNNNDNRFALFVMPIGAGDEVTTDATTGQIMAPNRNDDALKQKLIGACIQQFTLRAVAPTVSPVCGPNNDEIQYSTETPYITYTQTGWTNNINVVSASAAPNYTLTGDAQWTFPDNIVDGCLPQPPADIKVKKEFTRSCDSGVQVRLITTTTSYVQDSSTGQWSPTAPEVTEGEWTNVRPLNQRERHELKCVKKVFVCKYVGTPGVNERLKSGKNPISVSENATKKAGWNGTIGTWFNDAQGRSYVLGYDDGETTYDRTDCEPVINYVTPKTPVVHDACYSDQDYIVLPHSKHVRYTVNGESAMGKVPYAGTNLYVKAHAVGENYALSEGAQSHWKFGKKHFTDEQCVTITKSVKTASDTNLSGAIDEGDTIEWEITVTNTSNKRVFDVTVTDDTADWIEDDGYVASLEAGETRVLKATSTITKLQAASCKVTNTANMIVTRTQPRSEVRSLFFETEPTVLGEASDSATYEFKCPEVIHVLPGTTETPAKAESAVEVLPATLPMTGTSELRNALLTLFVGLSTYGAFYIARNRQ